MRILCVLSKCTKDSRDAAVFVKESESVLKVKGESAWAEIVGLALATLEM